MQQGEVSSVVMYLVTGSVSVVCDGEKRASVQAPAMIGHHSFIYRRPRTAAIICENHVVYFQVALDELLASATVAQVHVEPLFASGPSNFASCAGSTDGMSTPMDPVDPAHVFSLHASPASSNQQHVSAPFLATSSSSRWAPLSLNDADVRMVRNTTSTLEKSFVSHQLPSESAAELSIRDLESRTLPFKHATHQMSPPMLSSSISGLSRGLTGMAVSDSLGMMMRQHHVCIQFCYLSSRIPLTPSGSGCCSRASARNVEISRTDACEQMRLCVFHKVVGGCFMLHFHSLSS